MSFPLFFENLVQVWKKFSSVWFLCCGRELLYGCFSFLFSHFDTVTQWHKNNYGFWKRGCYLTSNETMINKRNWSGNSMWTLKLVNFEWTTTPLNIRQLYNLFYKIILQIYFIFYINSRTMNSRLLDCDRYSYCFNMKFNLFNKRFVSKKISLDKWLE